MLRLGCANAERLLEEENADSLGAADLPQSGRRPGFPADHLGEQAQSNGDDLAVLGESSDGLVQEALLFRRRLSTVGREAAECSAEFGQDLPRVQRIEE